MAECRRYRHRCAIDWEPPASELAQRLSGTCRLRFGCVHLLTAYRIVFPALTSKSRTVAAMSCGLYGTDFLPFLLSTLQTNRKPGSLRISVCIIETRIRAWLFRPYSSNQARQRSHVSVCRGVWIHGLMPAAAAPALSIYWYAFGSFFTRWLSAAPSVRVWCWTFSDRIALRAMGWSGL